MTTGGQTSERVVLVDASGQPIGVEEKRAAHRGGGRLHLAFSVFLFDAGGRMLLQQRSAKKYHFGGLWSNACCGHPRPGEPVAAAANRRLREELGVTADLRELFCFTYTAADASSGLTEMEYDHVFAGRVQGDPCPHPEEIDATRLVEPAAVLAELQQRPQAFTPWFAIALPTVVAKRGWC